MDNQGNELQLGFVGSMDFRLRSVSWKILENLRAIFSFSHRFLPRFSCGSDAFGHFVGKNASSPQLWQPHPTCGWLLQLTRQQILYCMRRLRLAGTCLITGQQVKISHSARRILQQSLQLVLQLFVDRAFRSIHFEFNVF